LILNGVDIPEFDKSSIVEVVVSNGAIIHSGNCLFCNKEYSRPKGKKPQKQDGFCGKDCKDKYFYRLKKGTVDEPKKSRKPKVMIPKPSDTRPKAVIATRPRKNAPPNKNKVDYLPKSVSKDTDRFKGCVLVPHPDPVKAAKKQTRYFNPSTKQYVN
jgi:hypothetical protein